MVCSNYLTWLVNSKDLFGFYSIAGLGRQRYTYLGPKSLGGKQILLQYYCLGSLQPEQLNLIPHSVSLLPTHSHKKLSNFLLSHLLPFQLPHWTNKNQREWKCEGSEHRFLICSNITEAQWRVLEGNLPLRTAKAICTISHQFLEGMRNRQWNFPSL